MSPITHMFVGWLIAQPLEDRRDRALVTAAAVLPDVDGLSMFGGEEMYWKYHHTFGHNVFFGILATALCVAFARSKWKTAWWAWVSFHSHLLCDLFGSGCDWPIQYFWPWGKGIHFYSPWCWGLNSWQNVLFSIVCIGLTGWVGVHKGRTVVELFSKKTDKIVVETLRRRFQRTQKRKREGA